MKRHNHLGAISGICFVMLSVLSVGGCSSRPDTASIDPGSFSALIAQEREYAETSGASDAQLALIDLAATRGEVILDDLRVAYENLAECIEGAGLELAPLHVDEKQVPPRPIVRIIGRGDESGMDPEDVAKADACVEREYDFLAFLYEVQPASVEAADAHFLREIPNIAVCLADRGYEIDSTLSIADFKEVLVELESPGGEHDYYAGEAIGFCLIQSGIYGF